jgi:gliding motility-associated-like protein
MIFNRWGKLITKINKEQANWNGLSHGEKCTEGVYFYRGVMRGEDKSGYFHLIR